MFVCIAHCSLAPGLRPELFDVFESSDVRAEEAVELTHYLARLQNSTFMYGDVGSAQAHALMQVLCTGVPLRAAPG